MRQSRKRETLCLLWMCSSLCEVLAHDSTLRLVSSFLQEVRGSLCMVLFRVAGLLSFLEPCEVATRACEGPRRCQQQRFELNAEL